MPRNVEIKARLSDPGLQLQLAQSHCGSSSDLIHQEDIFFHCPSGRLKLRLFADGCGELIHYHRADQSGPKTSSYVISKTTEPDTLRAALAGAYGVKAIVRKTRHLFMAGRTRIHLDQVQELGDFLELEVVLEDHEDVTAGEREASEWMKKLQVSNEMLVKSAYVDLLPASD